jgi:hypothetical protein
VLFLLGNIESLMDFLDSLHFNLIIYNFFFFFLGGGVGGSFSTLFCPFPSIFYE